MLDQREEEKWRAQQEELAQQRAQMEALARLQEEQRARLRREEAERIRDEKLAKLAPWAKVKEEEISPAKEQKRSLTLQEIQRMEAEKVSQELGFSWSNCSFLICIRMLDLKCQMKCVNQASTTGLLLDSGILNAGKFPAGVLDKCKTTLFQKSSCRAKKY